MAIGFEQRSAMTMLLLFLLITVSAPLIMATRPSYDSIFSFGDSTADTGNLKLTSSVICSLPPYGKTYFHQPTGRCSDGRLIIDFIAELLGIPLVKPYLGIKKGVLKNSSAKEGVNFAVTGATALEASFFQQMGVRKYVATNYSLQVQMSWFKEILPSLCNCPKRCHKVLKNSLFVVGEIGGNDINYPLFERRSIEEVKAYVPRVINAITSTISELIGLGARTLIVPGNFPFGCSGIYLTMYQTKDMSQYDSFGCLKWLNEVAEFHNQRLKDELQKLREIHPRANIIYGDYYNASLSLYQNRSKYGFIGLKACCGKGGPYNLSPLELCGKPGVVACDDPSKYIGWDGIHMTEAAHKLIAEGLINGPYTLPKFSNLSSKKAT